MSSVGQRGQMLVVGLHALLGISVLASATALQITGHAIDVELATLYGAIIGLAGGGSAAVSALGTAVNGKAAIPPDLIRAMIDNNRETIAHLAGARELVDAATSPGGRRNVDPAQYVTGAHP